MKCVCGYVYQEEIKSPTGNWRDDILAEGERPFIRIDGKFTVQCRGNWEDYIKDVRLYACPECGTVRMEAYP